jgi:hypothetical protein
MTLYEPTELNILSSRGEHKPRRRSVLSIRLLPVAHLINLLGKSNPLPPSHVATTVGRRAMRAGRERATCLDTPELWVSMVPGLRELHHSSSLLMNGKLGVLRVTLFSMLTPKTVGKYKALDACSAMATNL